MKFFDRPLVAPALLLGVALVIGLAFVGWGISGRGQDNVISVTGSASEAATANQSSWTIDISRTVYQDGIASASIGVGRDASAIARYFSSQNLASSTVITGTISTSQNYSSDTNTPTTYTVSNRVTVTTTDVDKIQSLSQNIGALNDLVSGDTIVSAEAPEYYLANLAALRISLLGAAIKDARARAEQIAQSGGSKVGALETASSGVVQVLGPGSTNADDSGQYDTSTIQKQVTVTVRANFYVR